MSADRMHADTYAVLRHLEVNGPRSRDEIVKGLQQAKADVTKRLANLLMLGYLAIDHTVHPADFTLTGKARGKLADPHAVHAPAPQPKPKKPREADTNALSAAKASRVAPRTPPKLHLNTPAAKSPVRTSQLTAPYRAAEYDPSQRPGANAALALPSRYGDRLHYRDGRVTDLAGNPLN